MKNMNKLLILLLFIVQNNIFGQNLPFDTLMNRAKLEVYNNPDKTISIANNLLKTEKDPEKNISVYMLLSKANIAKRNFDISLQHILKAKEIALKVNNINLQASVLISLAIQYQQMELYSKSLETLDEADLFLSKLPENDAEKNIETARSFAIKGMIYKNQANSEIALSKFLKSIEYFEKVKNNKTTSANKSVVFYNIGYCYIDLNQINKAKEAFLESIKWAQENKANSLEAFALKGLAEVNKLNGENQTALLLLEKSEKLCEKTGDLMLNEGINKEIADNYLALGNQKLYRFYSKKYFEKRFKREQNELISINHSIDNYTKEISIKNKEAKHQYIIILSGFAILGGIILSFLAFLALKIWKQNKVLKQEIKELIHQ